MPRAPRSRITKSLGALLACALPLAAAAQDAGDATPLTAWSAATDSTFERTLADLDGSTFAQREDAEASLAMVLASASMTPCPMLGAGLNEFLFATARRDDLGIEQRARLLGLLRERFDAMPRAGMGIQWQPADARNLAREPVVIGQTIDSFPCHELGLLFPGDIITEGDGKDLRIQAMMLPLQMQTASAMQQTFRYMILSHHAGDSIRVTGLRPVQGDHRPKPFDVDVPLGRYADLRGNATNRLHPTELEFAWWFYSQRHALPTANEVRGPSFALGLDPQDQNEFREEPALTPCTNLNGGVFNPGVHEIQSRNPRMRRPVNMRVQRAPNMRGVNKADGEWEIREVDGQPTPVLSPDRRRARARSVEPDSETQEASRQLERVIESLTESRNRKAAQVDALQALIDSPASGDLAETERRRRQLEQARSDLERLSEQLESFRESREP